MKMISWNVNGLRACLQKGFQDFFDAAAADFFCVQETKMQPEQLELTLPGYRQYWNSAAKKGYSGTAIFAKTAPLSARRGLGVDRHDQEGRVITLEYEAFYLINVYTPNSQQDLIRLPYRKEWEDDFRAYAVRLNGRKPVVICGDLNVAHQEIDLKNPRANRGAAGFSDDERAKMTELLAAGFTDSFRYLHPDQTGAYSWWSYMRQARSRNAGWRIDYFLVGDALRGRIQNALIYSEVYGSDHCPVGLEIDL